MTLTGLFGAMRLRPIALLPRRPNSECQVGRTLGYSGRLVHSAAVVQLRCPSAALRLGKRWPTPVEPRRDSRMSCPAVRNGLM